MADLSEQVALAQVNERLTSRYVDLPPERISSVIRDAHERFAGSRIRAFVPLLVERRAREELLSLSAATA